MACEVNGSTSRSRLPLCFRPVCATSPEHTAEEHVIPGPVLCSRLTGRDHRHLRLSGEPSRSMACLAVHRLRRESPLLRALAQY